MNILDSSFKPIKVINKQELSDDLGCFLTTYVINQVIDALLARTGTNERTVANQTTTEEVFILVTKNKDVIIKPGDIVQGDGKTCIVTSFELASPIKSQTMKDIRQWSCKSYSIPNGVVIE